MNFYATEENIIFLDKVIGNIFDEDIIEKWNKEVNEGNYEDNVKKMF
jgi:hypothetical protein